MLVMYLLIHYNIIIIFMTLLVMFIQFRRTEVIPFLADIDTGLVRDIICDRDVFMHQDNN